MQKSLVRTVVKIKHALELKIMQRKVTTRTFHAAENNCVYNHGRRKDFFQGGASKGFSQNFFQGGPKSGKIWFLPLEIEKTTFFSNNFKIQGGARIPSPLSNAHVYNKSQNRNRKEEK